MDLIDFFLLKVRIHQEDTDVSYIKTWLGNDDKKKGTRCKRPVFQIWYDWDFIIAASAYGRHLLCDFYADGITVQYLTFVKMTLLSGFVPRMDTVTASLFTV